MEYPNYVPEQFEQFMNENVQEWINLGVLQQWDLVKQPQDPAVPLVVCPLGVEPKNPEGSFDITTEAGDPTKSLLVQEYIAYKQMEQGLSGHKKREAPTMSRPKMNKLMRNMELHIRGAKGIVKLRLAERRAMYAFCFTAIKRLAGAGYIIAPNTIRMPNNGGLVFDCTWDKTLRMDSHCFGFFCMKGEEPWCAHCIIDEWVLLAKSMLKLTFTGDSFFQGCIIMEQ